MNSSVYIKQILYLIKKNKNKFYQTFIISLLLVFCFQILFNIFLNKNPEVNHKEKGIPGYFQVYIENTQTGDPYTNSYLVEEWFQKKDIVKEIETVSFVNFSHKIEEFRNENTEYTYGLDGNPIKSHRHTSTHIMTFTIDIGSKVENLKVANAYFDLITGEAIPLLKGKRVEVIKSPEAIEEDEVGFSSDNILGNLLSLKSIVTSVIMATVGGLALGTILVLLKELLDKKINYGIFTNINENDKYYYIETNNISLMEIVNIFIKPENSSKIILSEETDVVLMFNKILKSKVGEEIKNKSLILRDIDDLPYFKKFDEIIIILEQGITSKNWYNNQRKIMSTFSDKLIKVVEVRRR